MEHNGNRIGAGEAIAFLGAGLLLYALFQPWYSFRLPEEAVQGLGSVAGGAGSGAIAEAFREGLSQLARTPLEISGWQAFSTLDIVLAAIAAAAAAVALGSVFTAPASVGKARSRLGTLGLAAAIVVGLRIIARPAPAELLTVESGAWMALAGSVAIVVGGWLAVGRAEHAREAPIATVHQFPDIEPEPAAVAATAGEQAVARSLAR